MWQSDKMHPPKRPPVVSEVLNLPRVEGATRTRLTWEVWIVLAITVAVVVLVVLALLRWIHHLSDLGSLDATLATIEAATRPCLMRARHLPALGAEVLGPETWAVIGPQLDRAYAGTPSIFEFTHEPSSRRVRVALTPDPTSGGVYILSMDITEETQTRAALQQTRRREMAA